VLRSRCVSCSATSGVAGDDRRAWLCSVSLSSARVQLHLEPGPAQRLLAATGASARTPPDDLGPTCYVPQSSEDHSGPRAGGVEEGRPTAEDAERENGRIAGQRGPRYGPQLMDGDALAKKALLSRTVSDPAHAEADRARAPPEPRVAGDQRSWALKLGKACGVETRRYHGLLVAPARPAEGPMMLNQLPSTHLCPKHGRRRSESRGTTSRLLRTLH